MKQIKSQTFFLTMLYAVAGIGGTKSANRFIPLARIRNEVNAYRMACAWSAAVAAGPAVNVAQAAAGLFAACTAATTLLTSCDKPNEPDPGPTGPTGPTGPMEPEKPKIAEVVIPTTADFMAKATEITNHLANGADSVYVDMKQNQPTTAEVLGALPGITGPKVVWTKNISGLFVPATANQEINGKDFENLPLGRNGDMRFYIPGKNDPNLLKFLKDLANTDTISTSRFPTNLRAQYEIYVNTGRAGTLEGAVGAEHFADYNIFQTPIKVITLDGKQLVLENVTADIIGSFLTCEVRAAHNFGYTNNRMDLYFNGGQLMNKDFGPNGPFHLMLPNGVYNDLLSNYADMGVKSFKYRNGDKIDEAGYFVNGKNVSNSALNVLERSYIDFGSIDFMTEVNAIDIRRTQFSNIRSAFKTQSGEQAVYYDLRYLGWPAKEVLKSKENNATFKVGPEAVIVFHQMGLSDIFNYAPGKLWQPSPKAPGYMLDNYNIVLDHKPDVQAYPLEFMVVVNNIVPSPMREAGGWVRGMDWDNYWGRECPQWLCGGR